MLTRLMYRLILQALIASLPMGILLKTVLKYSPNCPQFNNFLMSLSSLKPQTMEMGILVYCAANAKMMMVKKSWLNVARMAWKRSYYCANSWGWMIRRIESRHSGGVVNYEFMNHVGGTFTTDHIFSPVKKVCIPIFEFYDQIFWCLPSRYTSIYCWIFLWIIIIEFVRRLHYTMVLISRSILPLFW